MINKKYLTVCKANQVIEASYRLTLNEQRVVLACIAQIQSDEALLTTAKFELSAKEFAELFSLSEKRAYLALVDVAESLFRRYVVIDQPFSHDRSVTQLKVHWISSIQYKQDMGKIVLCFSQDMLPYLSKLKGQFTRYKLEYIGNMTSVYAIRLYELLMQWKTTGKREVELAWLKKQFQIEEQYAEMADFKKRVLLPAVADINEHSDYKVSWDQRKTGRNVTHLIFTFSEKPSNKPAPPVREPKIFGVSKSVIEKQARIGESWEDAARRIKAEKNNQV
jgi:plasmid replication initiation protein